MIRRTHTGTPELHGRALSLLCFALAVLTPHAASAQWKDFLPTPYENHAFLDTYGSYERDSTTNTDRDLTWEDTFLRERLTLQSRGYSYDPRFVQYQLSLSGLATQENYDSTAFDTGGWDFGGGFEYDARLFLLPEHPYNLQLFASRYEPLYKQQAASSHDGIADTYGAMARYRRKPYFLNAAYVDTTLHSSGSSSNVKQLALDGEYFKRFRNGYEVSAIGAVRPSWYDSSEDLQGSAQEYLLGNFVNLKRIRLNSSVSQNSFEQDRDPDQNYDADQFQWWEQLSVYLPWNFRTNLAYRYHDNQSDVAIGDDPKRNYSDDGNNVQLDVIHRLYESLDTTYRLQHDSRSSSGGDTTLLSNSLSIDYNKRIPRGRFATGVSVGRTDTDNSGFADIVNDPYTATAVPGMFALRQQNVDPDTIIVFLESPLPPFDTILLVEGVHYQKNTAVEPFEIQIVSLPVEFAIPGTYDFYVSYSLLSGDFELQSDTLGASMTFQLFDDLLTPYARYLALRSDVLNGQTPFIPTDSDTYTAGLLGHYGPVRTRSEFQYVDWKVNPHRSWMTEIRYIGSLGRNTSTYATASYMNRQYLGGQNLYYSNKYTEQTVTTAATVTRQLPFYNMYVSAGGSYSYIDGLIQSNAWSVNSNLVWHIGKLDISIGVSAYGADNSGGLSTTNERNRELIYVNLRRQLL